MNKQVAVAAGTATVIVIVVALYARSILAPRPDLAQDQSSGQAATAPSPIEANSSGQDQAIPDSVSSAPLQMKSFTEASARSTPTDDMHYPATPTTTEQGRVIASLQNQLRCAQLEVAVINHFLNNYDNAPTKFSSQSHFDTKIDKCFVELRYDQFCGGGDNCSIQALYNATDNIILECYGPVVPSPDFETGCDNPKNPRAEISTTTYDRALVEHMTE